MTVDFLSWEENYAENKHARPTLVRRSHWKVSRAFKATNVDRILVECQFDRLSTIDRRIKTWKESTKQRDVSHRRKLIVWRSSLKCRVRRFVAASFRWTTNLSESSEFHFSIDDCHKKKRRKTNLRPTSLRSSFFIRLTVVRVKIEPWDSITQVRICWEKKTI